MLSALVLVSRPISLLLSQRRQEILFCSSGVFCAEGKSASHGEREGEEEGQQQQQQHGEDSEGDAEPGAAPAGMCVVHVWLMCCDVVVP